MTRLLEAIRRRPHRLVELAAAVLGVATAFGLELDPGQRVAVLGMLATLVGGSEVAQTKTTPLARPRARDGSVLVPAKEPNGAALRERGAD